MFGIDFLGPITLILQKDLYWVTYRRHKANGVFDRQAIFPRRQMLDQFDSSWRSHNT